MQNFAAPHAPAQHLPAGWTFPTTPLTAAPAPGPVTGGGAVAASTVTKVRWGRIALMVVGAGLVAVAIWASFSGSTTKDSDASARADTSRIVDGGGSGDIGIPPARVGATASPKVTIPTADTKKVDAIRAAAAKKAAAARAAAARRAAAKRAAATAAASGGVAAATTSPAAAAAATSTSPAGRTVAGGGTAGELPYTGAATWIAAIIGALALLLGVLVHVNAVRIGMTAILYRRGILLRPTDLARLAHRRGMPRARIVLSNVLHRLLEVPSTSGEFVTARHA